MYEISLQTYIPTLILKCEPKNGPSCRRQVVHPRPQTPQEESVAKSETPLLIILSIACKWGSVRYSKSKIRGQKHPREVVNKANLRDLIAATGLVILLNFDPNHQFFSPCELEISWMTLENKRAPLLYYVKLCASFQIHRWIETEVTVRKH